MADFKELNEALDIEYWAERESIPFKLSRGSSGPQINFKDCPFCGDSRWRAYMGTETGLGNCFVCDGVREKPFTKMNFVHEHLGESWRRTFEHVKDVLSEQGWKPRRTTTVAVDSGEIKLPTSFPLPTSEGLNLDYLRERGITDDLCRYFHLRYCDMGWWNYTKQDGTSGGMCFDERVIIPVYDLDGSLKTFQGRDVTGKAERKYLFPIALPGTGRYLYNGQNALSSKRAILGEGVFDVIAVKSAIDLAPELRDILPLGSFGKHLSYGSMTGDDQLGRFMQLRKQGLEEITIMWDGEPKALLAALSTCELLTKYNFRTRIALLPAGKDPNEVLPEVVQEAYWKAQPYSKTLAVKWKLRNPYSA